MKNNGKQKLQELCKSRKIKFDEVDAILELYGSDKTEDEIEKETQKYSSESIQLAASIVTGRI